MEEKARALVLLVPVVRAAAARLDLVGMLPVALTAAATAVYAGAEGMLVWPVLAAGMDAEELGAHLDPAHAQTVVLSRDGLHAPAAVLTGFSVLLIAWLLLRSDLWGHRVMAGLAALSGAWALPSVIVGPDGLGPGLIFVVRPTSAAGSHPSAGTLPDREASGRRPAERRGAPEGRRRPGRAR